MCDTLCVRTREGMLFAKNSDRHPGEAQVCEWNPPRAPGGDLQTQYLTIPDAGAFGFVGSRPTWLWGVEHGVNEHRVAIGNEKIFTVEHPGKLPPALLGMDLVRLGLERGRTADDAVDVMTTLLERFGQGGSGEPHADEPYFSSFLVVDPDGGWIVETSNRTWVARPVGDGAAVSNRVSLGTDWTRASADVAPGTDFDRRRHPKVPTGRADHRLKVTRAAVAAGSHTGPEQLAATLRHHGPGGTIPHDEGVEGEGYSVCMHRPEVHSQTTAAMIVRLQADEPTRIWTALGNPCTSVFVPGFPPALAPELADPREWERARTVRDRVERGELDLAFVRSVLDPIEADLWAAADAQRVPPAYEPVAAALHRLGG